MERTVQMKRQKYITWDIRSLETISEPLGYVGTYELMRVWTLK